MIKISHDVAKLIKNYGMMIYSKQKIEIHFFLLYVQKTLIYIGRNTLSYYNNVLDMLEIVTLS